MSRKVRAKFSCHSVEHFPGGKTARLYAVNSTDEDNKDFTDTTPSGSLEITINNTAPAVDFFEPGKNYYLDFSEAAN